MRSLAPTDPSLDAPTFLVVGHQHEMKRKTGATTLDLLELAHERGDPDGLINIEIRSADRESIDGKRHWVLDEVDACGALIEREARENDARRVALARTDEAPTPK